MKEILREGLAIGQMESLLLQFIRQLEAICRRRELSSANGGDLPLLEQCREHIYESCKGFNACKHAFCSAVLVIELMDHTNSIMKRKLRVDEEVKGGELAKGDYR